MFIFFVYTILGFIRIVQCISSPDDVTTNDFVLDHMVPKACTEQKGRLGIAHT